MGIDYSGCMLVGEHVSKLKIPKCECEWEWADDNNLKIMSPYYDAPFEDCKIGYQIEDVKADDLNTDWLEIVKSKCDDFYNKFGVKAILMGEHNIF